MRASVLIVDDEQAFLDSLARMLRMEGYENLCIRSDSTQVPQLIEKQRFDVAFLDVTMPELDGMDLLKIIKEKQPQTECIMLTAQDSIQTVMQATRLGAYDYLIKPILPERVIHSLEKALEHRRLLESLRMRSETAQAQTLNQPEAFQAIVTGNSRMLKLLHEAELHAASRIPVLITGETGVGKELLAQAVHRCSRMRQGAFVPVNMLALSPTLFESEFFGHVKGAFTGAERNKTGYLASADQGSLFLDEIGDLSLEIQGKLLRILQEGEFTPVGSSQSRPANVRFIAATNQNLEEQVRKQLFRKDLFYRLQFAHLHLPPLRERRDDIPLLCAHALERFGKEDMCLSDAALQRLQQHDWPGNVRELMGILEAAVNLAEQGEILPSHLRLPKSSSPKPLPANPLAMDELQPLEDIEREHILRVYNALDHNKSQTARALGIGLQTLHRKLKSYEVS